MYINEIDPVVSDQRSGIRSNTGKIQHIPQFSGAVPWFFPVIEYKRDNRCQFFVRSNAGKKISGRQITGKPVLMLQSADLLFVMRDIVAHRAHRHNIGKVGLVFNARNKTKSFVTDRDKKIPVTFFCKMVSVD